VQAHAAAFNREQPGQLLVRLGRTACYCIVPAFAVGADHRDLDSSIVLPWLRDRPGPLPSLGLVGRRPICSYWPFHLMQKLMQRSTWTIGPWRSVANSSPSSERVANGAEEGNRTLLSVPEMIGRSAVRTRGSGQEAPRDAVAGQRYWPGIGQRLQAPRGRGLAWVRSEDTRVGQRMIP
jgi:hypothetical protein